MRKLLFLLLFITSQNLFSQSYNLTGIISDEFQKPLESANIIAKPLQEKATIKFAITDNKGRYRLELDSNVKYEITVSYIGYQTQTLVVEPFTKIETHNFSLKSSGQVLDEIVIKHDFKPIVIKKDTLTFDVKSFANGNERKMKEILEKLPGVEVDKKGEITVQGKKVTKMLVEGKSFFGGGSKLAVENIPADALDKIEVIDHFNEVGFMKNVSDSEDLAMNVKLKEDKKEFIFGDLEAGAEVANDNGFYLAHSSLFYYSPKSNISFIGDANNIGKSSFTIDDLIRFQGGVSSYLNGKKAFTNLNVFTNDNTDVIQNKSQFGALNFSTDLNEKLVLSGYGIFSKVIMSSASDNKIQYLQNGSADFEDKKQSSNNETLLGIGNIKVDYSPNKNEKLYYNLQFQSSSNDINSTINSITNQNNSVFETLSTNDNNSLKQYIEWHKNYNEKNTTTFVTNYTYEKNKPTNNWFSSLPFLSGLIPLQTDDSYNLNQLKSTTSNSLEVLFKHYWIINDKNHLYTNLGNNFTNSKFTSNENQLLTNGSIYDFSNNGFGNNINYKLNDVFVGFEFKFRIGKWTNRPGIYLHQYNLKTSQFLNDNTISKVLIQPQWNSDFEFNKSETLNFSYKLSNTFPEVSQLANQYTLQTYNTVFKGNALLENERYHTALIRYSKLSMYNGVIWSAISIFNKKVKTTRNQIEIDGINQFTTPILTDNPETNLRVMGSVSKKIYKFSIKAQTNISWFEYKQTLNNITTLNTRNSQNFGLSLRTANKKLPDFNIGYNKGFNQFRGVTNSEFQTDEFLTDLEIVFLKDFVWKFEYQNFKNRDKNQSNYYDIANTSLRYQKKNSPFGFELFANNLFNNQVKNSYSFSDYMISEQKTYILPRALMFSISYKL